MHLRLFTVYWHLHDEWSTSITTRQTKTDHRTDHRTDHITHTTSLRDEFLSEWAITCMRTLQCKKYNHKQHTVHNDCNTITSVKDFLHHVFHTSNSSVSAHCSESRNRIRILDRFNFRIHYQIHPLSNDYVFIGLSLSHWTHQVRQNTIVHVQFIFMLLPYNMTSTFRPLKYEEFLSLCACIYSAYNVFYLKSQISVLVLYMCTVSVSWIT